MDQGDLMGRVIKKPEMEFILKFDNLMPFRNKYSDGTSVIVGV